MWKQRKNKMCDALLFCGIEVFSRKLCISTEKSKYIYICVSEEEEHDQIYKFMDSQITNA